MKKSLVLAMAMALGVTASAYAANPFSDVPAGHWAYDSISKLAAAGVIEGYGDDTFRGDRLMTRYEMAQIVAKAMAKGANVEKLAAEFADELDALGVRVAALEKKSDNVKITGQVRWNYEYHKTQPDGGDSSSRSRHRLRTRLWFDGKVNDNWTYRARLENVQQFHHTGNQNLVGEDNTSLNQAYLTGRLGGVKVTAGRYTAVLGNRYIYEDKFDGIRLDYGKKVRLGAYAGKPTGHQDSAYNTGNPARGIPGYAQLKSAWGVNLDFDLGKKATLGLAYDRFTEDDATKTGRINGTAREGENFGIFTANLYGKFSDKFGAGITYQRSNGSDSDYIRDDAGKNGLIASLDFGGADYNKPGSWGFSAKYFHAAAGTALAHYIEGGSPMDFTNEGYKGYSLAADYTIAKGMKYMIEWVDLKGRETNNKHKVLWNEFQLRF